MPRRSPAAGLSAGTVERVDRPPSRTGRAAAQIGGLTVASRAAGFARMLVFVAAVGATDLGDMYQTANTVPNIIFEIVAGGALASLVVPLLAGAVSRGDRDSAGATTSALLTWVLTLLVPAALVVAIAAGPIVRLLAPGTSDRAIAVGADMLRVFAPQLPLYGVGIVLGGALQSYRRFAWPALAPLLSSLTVMAAYAVFVIVAPGRPNVAQTPRTGVLVLSIGTTLGVAVLSLCLLVPLRRLGLRLRAGYRFHGDAGGAVRRLAAAGVVTVGAQQLSLGLAIALGNAGPIGSVVLYSLAQTMFLLPWAVFALPIATSVYPALAEAAARDDTALFRRTLAPAVRGLVVLAWLGAAALVALALPLARVLGPLLAKQASVTTLAGGIASFAPGLIGFALSALLTRTLYARGDTWRAAAGTVAGWGAVALASIVLALALPPASRVVALALANSAGMLVLGGVLVAMVIRRVGRGAFDGVVRAAAGGAVAAAGAAAAGYLVVRFGWGGSTPSVGAAAAQGMLSGVVVGLVFVGILAVVDRRDLRPLVSAVTRVRARSQGEAAPAEEVVR
jgi:putative peptidoglycan lipid II flippase